MGNSQYLNNFGLLASAGLKHEYLFIILFIMLCFNERVSKQLEEVCIVRFSHSGRHGKIIHFCCVENSIRVHYSLYGDTISGNAE